MGVVSVGGPPCYGSSLTATMLVPAGSLLLDVYPNALFAYSFRKLRAAYAGSAVRIRRSSDNAEQDIGFVGNALDAASAASFIGGGSGFITTWYDQSLNSQNAVQSTAGSQPLYSASPDTMTFDGSNDAFSITASDIGDTSLTISAWGSLVSQSENTFGGGGPDGATFFSTRNPSSKMSPTLLVSANGGSSGLIFTGDCDAVAQGAKGATVFTTGVTRYCVGVFALTGLGAWHGNWDTYLNGSKDNGATNNFSLAGSVSSFTGATWYIADDPAFAGTANITLREVIGWTSAFSAGDISTLNASYYT